MAKVFNDTDFRCYKRAVREIRNLSSAEKASSVEKTKFSKRMNMFDFGLEAIIYAKAITLLATVAIVVMWLLYLLLPP